MFAERSSFIMFQEPECFAVLQEEYNAVEQQSISDSQFFSPDSVEKMLKQDEKFLEEENRFLRVGSISPYVYNRKRNSVKEVASISPLGSSPSDSSRKRNPVKEEKIYLCVYETAKLLRTSDAHLNGLAYRMSPKSDGRTKNFKVILHNVGTRTINVKAKLKIYNSLMDALTDIQIHPVTFTLAESECQNLNVSFECLKESSEQKSYGSVTLAYSVADAGNDVLRCDLFNARTSPSISQLSLQYSPNMRTPCEEIKESGWIIEPSEMILSDRNKTGRITLRNYTNRELKFKLAWLSVFLNVSPISGVLPANGEIGLRVTLPRKIKFGESVIKIVCRKEEKIAKVKVIESF